MWDCSALWITFCNSSKAWWFLKISNPKRVLWKWSRWRRSCEVGDPNSTRLVTTSFCKYCIKCFVEQIQLFLIFAFPFTESLSVDKRYIGPLKLTQSQCCLSSLELSESSLHVFGELSQWITRLIFALLHGILRLVTRLIFALLQERTWSASPTLSCSTPVRRRATLVCNYHGGWSYEIHPPPMRVQNPGVAKVFVVANYYVHLRSVMSTRKQNKTRCVSCIKPGVGCGGYFGNFEHNVKTGFLATANLKSPSFFASRACTCTVYTCTAMCIMQSAHALGFSHPHHHVHQTYKQTHKITFSKSGNVFLLFNKLFT